MNYINMASVLRRENEKGFMKFMWVTASRKRTSFWLSALWSIRPNLRTCTGLDGTRTWKKKIQKEK